MPRSTWARLWLFSPEHNTNATDDFTIVDACDATSDYGIESLPDASYAASAADGSVMDTRALSHYSLPYDLPRDSQSHGDEPINRFDGPAHERTGRGDYNHTFEDSRSASKSHNRFRANSEKYYGYRGVNQGELGRPHYNLSDHLDSARRCPRNAPVQIMTKQMLYQEAQKYPRPPTYSRRARHKENHPWTQRATDRRRDQKHADHPQEMIDEGLGNMYFEMLSFDEMLSWRDLQADEQSLYDETLPELSSGPAELASIISTFEKHDDSIVSGSYG